jgi:hypothetical protein
MKYTLITRKGRVMTFFIKSVAELYLEIEGGTLINETVAQTVQETV